MQIFKTNPPTAPDTNVAIRSTIFAAIAALLIPTGAAAQTPPPQGAPPETPTPTPAAATTRPAAPADPERPAADSVPPQDAAAAAAAAAPAGDRTRVYLFLAPIQAEGAEATGRDLASVLTRLARSRLNGLAEVKLKTAEEMPGLPAQIARFGDLERLDRVSLIHVKNVTGFDGMIRIHYRYERDGVQLTMTCIDFRNGEVFRVRKLSQPVDAALFATLEQDLVELASRIRRSYRVTVRVESNPPRSAVHINGEYVGKTPLLQELEAGEHTVRVTRDGYRSYEKRLSLSNGDTLLLKATLYNPLAARFLNAPPGLRIDSRQLNMGYRYVYLGLDRPALDHAHFFTVEGLLRIRSFATGLRLAVATPSTENPLDTFVGPAEGRQSYDHLLLQVQGVLKYALWEKYSFAAVHLCATPGMTFARTADGASARNRWSFSADVYAELVSRIARGGNFALELQVDLGLAYLGRLPYTEKSVSLFGEGPEVERDRHMVGPMGAISLRLNFYNDIF